MRKVRAAVIGAMLASVPLIAYAADPDRAVGRWRTQTHDGIVEIERCGASICGRITGSEALRANPNLLDVENKDKAKRARKLKGLQILGGFRRAEGKWIDGSVYNPEDGGTYGGTITLAGNDTLKLKGCIVWPLCKTQTWTRVR